MYDGFYLIWLWYTLIKIQTLQSREGVGTMIQNYAHVTCVSPNTGRNHEVPMVQASAPVEWLARVHVLVQGLAQIRATWVRPHRKA